jgi:hypothetical protein
VTVSRTFQKRTEFFACCQCGAEVQGDGYTNHCPHCLWSLHVDVYPGDRADDCRGPMQPIGIEKKNGEYRLVHQCMRCGQIRRNKAAKDDNFERLLALADLRNSVPQKD